MSKMLQFAGATYLGVDIKQTIEDKLDREIVAGYYVIGCTKTPTFSQGDNSVTIIKDYRVNTNEDFLYIQVLKDWVLIISVENFNKSDEIKELQRRIDEIRNVDNVDNVDMFLSR